MDVAIFTRNMEMTPHLSKYVDQKIGKLDRYLPWIDEARMDLSVENTRSTAHSQVAQLTVRAHGTILRAEERSQDIFASIDAVLDKMYRQIARYKGKRKDRFQTVTEEPPVEEQAVETGGEIVRVKRFEVRSMSPEEAIEQMELLGHSFYIFMHADDHALNVVYKRSDGNYGLLQPEA